MEERAAFAAKPPRSSRADRNHGQSFSGEKKASIGSFNILAIVALVQQTKKQKTKHGLEIVLRAHLRERQIRTIGRNCRSVLHAKLARSTARTPR
jgi:hypothetical protein